MIKKKKKTIKHNYFIMDRNKQTLFENREGTVQTTTPPVSGLYTAARAIKCSCSK